MRDGDVIYRDGFEDTLSKAGFSTKQLVYRSPNLKAYFERWVQSIQQECLDHFLVFGRQHFHHLMTVAHNRNCTGSMTPVIVYEV